MTEEPLFPSAEEVPEPAAVPSQPPPRNVIPWLYGLGFLILAAAIFYLWQYPNPPQETAANESALRNIEQRLSEIDSRLGRLEQRPAADTGTITARVDSLDKTITARVDALDKRIGDSTQIVSQLNTLSGKLEALASRDQTGLDATKQNVDALTARIAGLEANTVNLGPLTKRLNYVARLQQASFALISGKPVGDVPGAPEALARYAHAAPPTEAGLRLSFPEAEQAALAATQPNATNAPLIDRVWDRAQGLITVRQGGAVVLGNPAATALSRAHEALAAGDLAGAVAAVESLTGQPGQAMSTWLSEAKALLGAQSALTEMAGQA